MTRVPVWHVDAFSSRPGLGNPAGVVLDASGLGDAAMQAIARAVGFNETAFVLPSAVADLRLRYFTPGHEVDLCGHATIGSLVALRERGRLPGGARRLTVETGAGILSIGLDIGERGEPLVRMTQAPPRFVEWSGPRAGLARVLGIGEADLHPALPICYGSTGLWTLAIPVAGLAAIRAMRPLTADFPAVLPEMPGASLHPFCVETVDPAAHLHARHFSSPRSGTVEDPVTGTASGVLGAYYLRHVDPRATWPLIVEQGQEMGRDGRVRVWVEPRAGDLAVAIDGTGCTVREMAIEVPGG